MRLLVQKSTAGEAVLIQQSTTGLGRLCWYMSTIGTLGILYWYSGTLYEHSGGCAGTEECCRRTREYVLVQCYTIIALERLCCYMIYYMRTGEAVLVRKSTIGTLVRLLVE